MILAKYGAAVGTRRGGRQEGAVAQRRLGFWQLFAVVLVLPVL
jgi:hypothetical protein